MKAIPKKLRKIIDRELDPGEFIDWIGQPKPRFFTAASINSFLFAIPWTAFAIFWMYGASGFQLPNFSDGFKPEEHLFPLFGIPFVAIGFGMLTSPFWVWLKARSTAYVITDRRAIAFESGIRNVTIRSYSPKQLQEIFRRERRDGTGDIIITTSTHTTSKGRTYTQEIGFLGIDDPKSVERKLKQLSANS
ncbi:MAG: hypothetical protein AAGA60_03850 [Cyanobacteria bacterium P01_E01_bin.42]